MIFHIKPGVWILSLAVRTPVYFYLFGITLLCCLYVFVCREPRGFGFVQYLEPADAADAKHHMDGEILFGRELTVVFAEENRKKPAEMRARDRVSGGRYSDRRRSPSPSYGRSYSRSPVYSPSPRRRHYSRSVSPRDRRYRDQTHSRSPHGSRSYSRSPVRNRSRA
uniref:RRM domain-containing protein n=2 Tax=Salix viminalis TaxID=40686 RepID=A0A6N2NCN5_SALVM